MRIVHTSDWHAGRMWKNKNRLSELATALDELAAFVIREKADLMLVTGDVFDHGAPPADAERVVFEFFKRVGQAKVQTVVIAGNHDSPRRMAAWGALTRLVDVHVVDRACGPDDGGVLELHSREGERAVVAALPFSDVGEMVTALKLEDETEARAEYAERFASMVRALATRFRADAINLLLAHTHIHGAQLARSEREVSVGEQWAGTAEALPGAAHYVALGHIHKPQQVSAACPAQYAGSVLQLDFGEVGDEKSFVVVEATPGKPAKTHRVPYTGTQPLIEVRATLEELERDAARLSAGGWLRIRVPLSAPRPGLAGEVRKLLPNAVSVDAELPAAPESLLLVARDAMTERQRFEEYLQETAGSVNPRLVEAFEALRLEMAKESTA